MARRTIHMLIDDLDGGEAEETVTFALDGAQYEIDLSKKNAAKLRDTLGKYTAAGTRGSRGTTMATRRTAIRHRQAAVTSDPDQNRAIREWAQSKGMAVSDRGRIKQDIVDRYHAEAGR
jgi:hypothetical protein